MPRIRLYKKTDAAAFADILFEMQRHFSSPVSQKAARAASLCVPEGAEILIALEKINGRNTVLGFAAFATVFPGPRLAHQFFLKELYVAAAARRRGIGRRLMQALAALAVRRNVTRIDWTTEKRNRIARALYDSIGALVTGKLYYRLDNDALKSFADSKPKTCP